MHGFHQSRPRIFFEVLCALGISASFASAWLQTDALSFIPAAGIFALLGIVRAFDMIRRSPRAPAVAPQASASAPVDASDTVIRTWPLPATAIDKPESVERPSAKAPRKKRRTSKPAPPKQEPEVVRILPEPQPDEAASEPEHAQIAPLFEPEPFLRTQRTAFGRKTG